jgi:hypothetical protein
MSHPLAGLMPTRTKSKALRSFFEIAVAWSRSFNHFHKGQKSLATELIPVLT